MKRDTVSHHYYFRMVSPSVTPVIKFVHRRPSHMTLKLVDCRDPISCSQREVTRNKSFAPQKGILTESDLPNREIKLVQPIKKLKAMIQQLIYLCLAA